MRHICVILPVFTIFLHSTVHCVKVFEFGTSLQDKSRVVISNKDAPSPQAFTLCLDFYCRLDRYRQILRTKNSADLDIHIDEGGDVIYVKVAGLWYLAVPEDPSYVDTVTWESLCVSYDSITQAVVVAFRGNIAVDEEKIIPNRTLSADYLQYFSLGEKDSLYHFAGEITHINIWSKVLDKEIMRNITRCGEPDFQDIPDILDWNNVDATIEGDVIERSLDEYPCNPESRSFQEVLMPEGANSMYDAIKTCKLLRGNLTFPSKKQEVAPFLTKVKSKVGDSKCNSYVWSNYYKNSFAQDNWTIYDSETTYWYPPFTPAGWIEWALGQPNGKHLQECGALSIRDDEQNLFFDMSCYDKGYCFMCR